MRRAYIDEYIYVILITILLAISRTGAHSEVLHHGEISLIIISILFVQPRLPLLSAMGVLLHTALPRDVNVRAHLSDCEGLLDSDRPLIFD